MNYSGIATTKSPNIYTSFPRHGNINWCNSSGNNFIDSSKVWKAKPVGELQDVSVHYCILRHVFKGYYALEICCEHRKTIKPRLWRLASPILALIIPNLLRTEVGSQKGPFNARID
jgi:hypothetical protein